MPVQVTCYVTENKLEQRTFRFSLILKRNIEVKRAVKIPVLIGSGVTLDNVRNYLDANALIIGSYFKREGYWANGVDPDRVKKFMEHISKLRE